MLCITLLILILYPIVSTSSQFDISFKPNSFFVILALIVGLIMSYSTYALVLVYIITFISSLIWSVKAFNLISDKKHTFTQYSWLTFIFRILPLFSLYTRYRILKDLYTEHSTKDTYEKRLIYIWYIFYLLVWGALFFMTRKDLESDSPLYFWVVWIMIFFAIISFCYFNKILKRINKFQDSVIKGDAENINIEVKENKIETKKFNYKNILYVLWGLIIVYLIIAFWISYYGKIKRSDTSKEQFTNNIKVEVEKPEVKKTEVKKENKWSDITVSNQEIFENTIKCQEFKEEFFADMVPYFESQSMYDQKIGSHYYSLLMLGEDDIGIFYSPVTNSCIWTAHGFGTKWDSSGVGKEIEEWMYVVKDLFSPNICKVKETIYYEDVLWERIEFFNKCDWLAAYDSEMFTTFRFTWTEMYNNMELAKEIFENEVNYLKWN